MSDNNDELDNVLGKMTDEDAESMREYGDDNDSLDNFYIEDSEGNVRDPRGNIVVSSKKKKERVETISETDTIKMGKEERIIEKKTTTVETITTVSKSTKDNDKKERIIAEGQKDLEGNDASNINFGGLVTRNVMKATHKILENYLVLFPRYGFKNEISGMILYGPNGTGKTEFCNSIMIRQEFTNYCDFEKVDIYDLIDSKMGATSEKVADKFKEWIDTYKKKNRIQVKIIDEGELVFLQKKDRGSKAYSELSNSMLKHTGKFNGIFIILITNDLEYLNKGAISRFDRIYWPPLDVDERLNFMRYKLENSGIKVDMTNLNKLSIYLDMRYGDIRTHNKFVSDFKGWFVRSKKLEDIVDEKDLIPLIVGFNEKMDSIIYNRSNGDKKREGESEAEVISLDDEFIYPEEEEMIDYLIKFSKSNLKTNWIEFKERWEMKGCVGNQLENHLKPSYRKLRIAIENRVKKE